MAISGCIRVKNEADLLPQCLRSIVNHVDEIIVVDNGSTDETLTIAESFGCRVISLPNAKEDTTRNTYLEAASEPWIFVIDADELITPEGGEEMRRAVTEAPPTTLALWLPMFNYVGHGRWASLPMMRLYRCHPRIRYGPTSVHTSVTYSIEMLGGKLDFAYAPLHHLDILYHNRTARKREARIQELVFELKNSKGLDLRHHRFLGLEYVAIGQLDEAEAEYRAALELGPHISINWLFLAYLHLLQGNLAAAEHEADAAFAFNDGVKEQAAVVLAEVAWRQNRTSDALEICTQSLARAPTSPHMHLNVAALLEDSNPSQAIEHLERAIALNPFLLKPVIYGPGEMPNVYTHQSSFLSLYTRTVGQYMARCWQRLGETRLASDWRQADKKMQEALQQGQKTRLFDSISPQ